MSQFANWLIRTTSIFLVILLTSLPECKITILGKQSQENERREVRIYTIKIIPLKEVGLPWGKPTRKDKVISQYINFHTQEYNFHLFQCYFLNIE